MLAARAAGGLRLEAELISRGPWPCAGCREASLYLSLRLGGEDALAGGAREGQRPQGGVVAGHAAAAEGDAMPPQTPIPPHDSCASIRSSKSRGAARALPAPSLHHAPTPCARLASTPPPSPLLRVELLLKAEAQRARLAARVLARRRGARGVGVQYLLEQVGLAPQLKRPQEEVLA